MQMRGAMRKVIILAALLVLAVSGPARANSHVDLVCQEIDGTISELIKYAPKGTGLVNRVRAWFENLYAIFGDFFFEGGGELTEVLRAVNGIDFYHSQLYFELMTILNVEGEVVEDMLPSKFYRPVKYIIQLEGYKKLLIDPQCKRYQRG